VKHLVHIWEFARVGGYTPDVHLGGRRRPLCSSEFTLQVKIQHRVRSGKVAILNEGCQALILERQISKGILERFERHLLALGHRCRLHLRGLAQRRHLSVECTEDTPHLRVCVGVQRIKRDNALGNPPVFERILLSALLHLPRLFGHGGQFRPSHDVCVVHVRSGTRRLALQARHRSAQAHPAMGPVGDSFGHILDQEGWRPARQQHMGRNRCELGAGAAFCNQVADQACHHDGGMLAPVFVTGHIKPGDAGPGGSGGVCGFGFLIKRGAQGAQGPVVVALRSRYAIKLFLQGLTQCLGLRCSEQGLNKPSRIMQFVWRERLVVCQVSQHTFVFVIMLQLTQTHGVLAQGISHVVPIVIIQWDRPGQRSA